jgi:tryptophan synthase alpha chain
VSTPAQAASLVGTADGVIVGSALMRLLLDGSSPAELGVAVGALREAIDAGLAEAS